MSYRLAKVGGLSLSVEFDDSFRSSFIWQRGVRPVAHTSFRYIAAARGLVGRALDGRPAAALAAPEVRNVSPAQQAVYDRIGKVHGWFQTIDLGNGVVTPGAYDHRPLLKHYPIPERLDGLRVLDAGTADGFWAFEMERRGARDSGSRH